MTIMIALVGEQPQPNFLPVLQDEPSDVMLIYTTKTEHTYESLKKVIEKKNIHVYGIETDPYDIAETATALNEKLAKMTALSLQTLVFNLTGGTKAMYLAAYQIAAQRSAPVIYLRSEEGQSIIDRYSWQDHQLYRQQQELLTKYFSLHDVLNLQLGQGTDMAGKDIWKEKGPTIQSNGGHLFELAIAQTLNDHNYEIMCGVKGRNNQVDIDVMIRYQNQVGIIEAKTGSNVTNLDGVKQLSTAMRYLGGTYIRQFLVINGKPSNDQQMVCELLNIHIISLLHYQNGMTALTQEDTDTLLTTIDKIMKVAMARSANIVEKQ